MKENQICPLRVGKCSNQECIKEKCEWYSGLAKTCCITFITTILYFENQGMILQEDEE